MESYKAKQFNLSGLNGISDQTLEMHFKLYEGYVTNTNALTDRLQKFFTGGKMAEGTDALSYAELTRRLGFEYNGMVLHEYYFENMKKGGQPDPDKGSKFRATVEKSHGDYDTWKADFFGIGKMRGVGWAICFQDPSNGRLSNHWISLHQEGNIAGYTPILVMDVWEHAFLLDYKPAERPKYIESFFSNIDWNAIDSRLK